MKSRVGTRWAHHYHTWLENCQKVHQNKYLYLNTFERILDENGRWKVRVECREHGEFLITPGHHTTGKGCPRCSGHRPPAENHLWLRETWPEVSWPEVPATSKSKIKAVCPAHGEFTTRVNSLRETLKKSPNKKACPKCNRIAGGKSRRVPVATWVKRILEKFPDYEVDADSITTAASMVRYQCPLHGWREGVLQDVASGHGCNECAKATRAEWIKENIGVTWEEFLTRAAEAHGDAYTYSAETFQGMNVPTRIECKKHGEFWQRPSTHVGVGERSPAVCPRCSNSRTSRGEQELLDWLRLEGFTAEHGNRELLGLEMDVFLPDLNVAIEYCGLYWHGEKFKQPSYHLDKALSAKELGIRLVTLYEDQWLYDQERTKNRILDILKGYRSGGVEVVQVKPAGWQEVNEIHSQYNLAVSGALTATCPINYILCDKQGNRIAAASLRRPRTEVPYDLEIVRYTEAHVSKDGLTNLLLKLQDEHPSTRIYVDVGLCWGNPGAFEKLGFYQESLLEPQYFWAKANSERIPRRLFTREFVETLPKSTPGASVADNARANGYWRIHDCGKARMVKRLR
jgi:hypothetical protein